MDFIGIPITAFIILAIVSIIRVRSKIKQEKFEKRILQKKFNKNNLEELDKKELEQYDKYLQDKIKSIHSRPHKKWEKMVEWTGLIIILIFLLGLILWLLWPDLILTLFR